MLHCRLKFVNPKTGLVADEGDLALFIDGGFIASFHRQELPENTRLIENMLNDAFEAGKDERSKEIKKSISSLIGQLTGHYI